MLRHWTYTWTYRYKVRSGLTGQTYKDPQIHKDQWSDAGKTYRDPQIHKCHWSDIGKNIHTQWALVWHWPFLYRPTDRKFCNICPICCFQQVMPPQIIYFIWAPNFRNKFMTGSLKEIVAVADITHRYIGLMSSPFVTLWWLLFGAL